LAASELALVAVHDVAEFCGSVRGPLLFRLPRSNTEANDGADTLSSACRVARVHWIAATAQS
jgi:hypothetical protein